MQRRSFMAAMLAAAAAPAIVRAGSIMRINPRIIVPAGLMMPVDWQRQYAEAVNRAVEKLAVQIERDMFTDYQTIIGRKRSGMALYL